MDFHPLHAVGHIVKAQRICIGLCQQRRGHGFSQSLVAEQIQLVPAAICQPFFLIALRRGFRDAASRCQSDRHIQPSTILIQHESSAMRPSVLRMIASGS